MEQTEQFDMLMSQVIKPFGNAPVYNGMLKVKAENYGIDHNSAMGQAGEAGKAISPDYGFRTGSITKLFTATAILQLKEEGLLSLGDLYFDLVNDDTRELLSGLHLFDKTDYSNEISILHLLTHASGLQDYYSGDERFLQYVLGHPSQLWDWEKIMEKYFEFELNLKPSFAPGNGFHYSDTNYLLLAILIEQLTNKPLQQVYREKIFLSLGLADTYLEFYELPKQVGPVVFPYYGNQSLENINTSFDWGGGGLISTMDDLDIFIRALIKGRLFKKAETLDLLMRLQNTNSTSGNSSYSVQYGLGIQKKLYPEYCLVGHNSAYGSMLYYEPEKDISIVLSLNQVAAVHKTEWLMRKMVLSFPEES
jgi:D-alanyl-D-alanine carboxypeptidase